MKKINGTEIKEVKAIYGTDTEAQEAILIHDEADEFHDGDTIYFGYTMADIDDESDLKSMFAETGCTNFKIVNGIYIVMEA